MSASGILAVLVVRVMTTELLGPLGLAVGLLMRVAAVGIRCAMLVALISMHWPHGFFMHWTGTQQGEGCECHRLMIGITLPVLMRGADIWSLDRMHAGCTLRSRTQKKGLVTTMLCSTHV